MKQHAQNVREAIKNLPKSEGDPSTAEGSASSAREQAEAMAAELERGSPPGAVKRGRESKQSLEQAERLGKQAQGFFPEERAGREEWEAERSGDREYARAK